MPAPGDLSDPVHAVDRRPVGEHLRGLRAALVPSSTEDSSVYHAMWLPRITLSSAARGLSAGSGSRSNTSRPAAGAIRSVRRMRCTAIEWRDARGTQDCRC